LPSSFTNSQIPSEPDKKGRSTSVLLDLFHLLPIFR
jgi:hypothetical protein